MQKTIFPDYCDGTKMTDKIDLKYMYELASYAKYVTDIDPTTNNPSPGLFAFKKEAFEKDDRGYITHIIPPRSITSLEENVEWFTLDITKTKEVALSNPRDPILATHESTITGATKQNRQTNMRACIHSRMDEYLNGWINQWMDR